MLHRRDAMMRLGQLGLGTLTLPELCRAEAGNANRPARGKHKAGILIFLWGGPPQLDLWDPKPDAPEGTRSLFKPIQTNVPGILIGEQMPKLAKHMDKVAVVRSLTHPSDQHELSVHHMLTGKELPGARSFPRNQRTRSDEPFFGSVVSHFGAAAALPGAVTLPRPIGHDGVVYAGTHGGFLGPRFDPMEAKEAPAYNGNAEFKDKPRQASHPLGLPDDVNESRLLARQGLLATLESHERNLQKTSGAKTLGGFYEQAFRMISAPEAKRAFDLDREPVSMRDRYGRNEYGESFLLARRLVEAGVRMVSVIWMHIKADGKVINVWDNHEGYGIHGSKTGYDLLKSPACIPSLDQGYSALLEDLHERGMLDDTLVMAFGEFGRTPKINGSAGRDHWGRCQSALLAGGGVRGGQVYGTSDSIAAYPKDSPVSPADMLATIYQSFGLAADREVHDREQRPRRICEGRALPVF